MKQSGLLILLSIFIFLSCRKENFITSPDARVRISADTLKYDTVFVTAGSVYQKFSIVNENNQKLRLTSIKLMGGSASAYKINVDGVSGVSFNNIELDANDSLYVFVQVNVDPTAANLPFIIRDSVEVTYNGKNKKIQLEAWGQNAHFFRNKIVSTPETWNNDLPYIILGSLTINQNQTLTINKGCRIYTHTDAPIIVNGSLQVNGMKDTADRVYFRGDRMDEPYNDFPGSWPGIIFYTSSKDNVLNYAVIKNAYQAIALQDPSSNANPKLTLNECIIDNAYDAGIISLNSSIKAVNSLISNCGKNIFLIKGGTYDFSHCTAVTYANRFIEHKAPVLLLSNFISVNNTPVTENLSAVFRNCIFWGENGLLDNEVEVLKSGSSLFNVNFENNLWKVQSPPANVTSTQIINNQSPLFDSINTNNNFYNFRLKAGSPAIDKGVNTATSIDLDGKPRSVGLPDLGCFERQ
ncbi:MAG TPA: choice-of-anchor Q domain-containing protein [Chitinophagaceae bacterium]|nr:choice-of-anchor Q domain-containing protein [Chitinophagaceae bacterium]HNN99469.1 choice-of-anchor Q domain-containing protein [Chitinophagaceae bacterium]